MSRKSTYRSQKLVSECLEDRRVLAQLLPDLFAWEGANDEYLHDYRIEGDLLRFSTALANQGEGHLEIFGGNALPNGNQEVYQRIFHDDGSVDEVLAGEFTYHPSHGHIHFDGYATYFLKEVNPDGSAGNVIATGGKVSFCLIDIQILNPGSGAQSNYGGCGSTRQGISAGWSDVYSSFLSDQWINIATVPDGDYIMDIVVDPDDQLIESDETNNSTQIPVTINRGGTTTGDVYEVNETLATATDLGTVAYIDLPGLSIHTDTDVDYFKFEAADSGLMEASILHTHSLGDLDFQAYDSNGALIGSSTTTNDIEQINWNVVQGDTYYVQVSSAEAGEINGYDLLLDGPGVLTTATIGSEDSNLPANIPDDGSVMTSTLEGPDLDLSDINLSLTSLSHTYVGDLEITLTSPAGTTATLLESFQGNGYLGSQDNFSNTLIDDQSPDFLGNASAPFTGIFNVNHPSVGDNPLAIFNGENALGTWTISIRDTFTADTGSLNAWGIQFTGVADPEGDRFEDNQDFPHATELGMLGTAHEEDLSIHHAGDIDVYRFTAQQDGYAFVDTLFTHADGDIELVVYNDSLVEIGRSATSTDNESLVLPVSTGELRYIEVLSADGSTNMDYALSVDVSVLGDFNADSSVDATDVDAMCVALANGSTDSSYDLNFDGAVNSADGETLVFDIMGALPGDANFDGNVDISDFNIWNQNKFTSTCYTGGDFNFNGVADITDFNIWNQNKFTSQNLVIVPADDIAAAELSATARVQSVSPLLDDVSTREVASVDQLAVPVSQQVQSFDRQEVSRSQSMIESIFDDVTLEDDSEFAWRI